MPAGRILPCADVCAADAGDLFVQKILKFRALALVASGPHIGDIVGDDLDVKFLGHHSRRCGVKCSHRSISGHRA